MSSSVALFFEWTLCVFFLYIQLFIIDSKVGSTNVHGSNVRKTIVGPGLMKLKMPSDRVMFN